MFPQLDNAPQALQGSRMFTPLDQQPQQQQQGQSGPPQNPMQQLQQVNAYLKQQLNVLLQHAQQQKAELEKLQKQGGSGGGAGGGKRTTDLLIVVMLVLFVAVLVVLFAFCRKVMSKHL